MNLRNVVLNQWKHEQQRYILKLNESFTMNEKPYWISENGNFAIWWQKNRWLFGSINNLGEDTSKIRSNKINGFLYPHEIGQNWRYYTMNGRIWLDGKDNIRIFQST